MSRNIVSCIICDHADFQPLYHPERSPGWVVRCRYCGFVFVQSVDDDRSIIDDAFARQVEDRLRHSQDLGDLTGCWEVTELAGKLDEELGIRANAVSALERIAQYYSTPGRLLDFGCGWGFFLRIAKEQGWLPYGLEPLPGHALYTRANVGAEVTTDVLREDTFPPDYFDVITSFQVFEHLPDPSGNLDLLKKTLRPGGIILIEVPNIDTWGVKLLGKRHRHYVPDHLNFFSAQTLGQLFQVHGLEILEHYYPTRQMSVRHLMTVWGGRTLPAGMSSRVNHLFRRPLFWEKNIRLNLGDIVAVVGRKPV